MWQQMKALPVDQQQAVIEGILERHNTVPGNKNMQLSVANTTPNVPTASVPEVDEFIDQSVYYLPQYNVVNDTDDLVNYLMLPNYSDTQLHGLYEIFIIKFYQCCGSGSGIHMEQWSGSGIRDKTSRIRNTKV
jgi:hypothetical protein